MALHHMLCQVVAGAFDLSHDWSHAAVLPNVTDINLDAETGRHTGVSSALGDARPGSAMLAMHDRMGCRGSRAASDIDQVVAAVLAPAPSPIRSG